MKMTRGVWSRKDVEFADLQTVNKAYTLISNHPYTIANTPELSLEYSTFYGSDELATLKNSCVGSKFNMVQSPTQKWVLGGVWLPPVPPPEQVLGPDEEWQEVMTPFGPLKRKVKKGTSATAAIMSSTVANLSDDAKRELSALVFDATTDALEAWSKRT